MIDDDKIKAGVALILEGIGEDPRSPRLAATPSRIADAYREIFSGIDEDPSGTLGEAFQESYNEMVIVRDIPFYSMCEHHFLPFSGSAHIGYLPNGSVLGVSKLARLVETLAKRPQLQERLTSQIADTIMAVNQPGGVGVLIRAEHLCMTMRGIKKPGSVVVTSAMRGSLLKSPTTRGEFLSLVESDRI